jgi:hypothetical protein
MLYRRVGCWFDCLPQCSACHDEWHDGRETFAAIRGKTPADFLEMARAYGRAYVAIFGGPPAPGLPLPPEKTEES